MRPTDFATQQRLDYARAHAELLRREWQAANGPRYHGSAPRPNRSGAIMSARRSLGRGLVRFGIRLIPATHASEAPVRSYRPDPC
jgi:hypothetical protein